MKVDEMIKVLQAHKEGKQVQIRLEEFGNGTHRNMMEDDPWNFFDYTYRVKPEPEYVPFETLEEVFEATKCLVHNRMNYRVFPWVRGCSKSEDIYVKVHNVIYTLGQAFEKLKFAETGKPFGKLK